MITNHEPDPVAEMYALWEQYNKLRSLGGKRLRPRTKQALNTFVECFKKQTPEVRTIFIGEVCTQIYDCFVKAPDSFWFGAGAGTLYILEMPIHIQSPFSDVLDEELDRLYLDNPSDAQIIRWRGLLCCEDKKTFAIQKDQIILRKIIATYIYRLGDACHEIPWGIFYESPELMNQDVTEARDYWKQLEPSTLKDTWNEFLLKYERIAKCWNDYCTHKSLYADFRQYMVIHQVEW
jgi:hypothetical protein